MTRLFTDKRLIVLLASIIILVVVASFTLRSRVNLSLPEKWVVDSFSTAQRYLYQPAAYISDSIESLRKISELYHENEILKNSVAGYAQVKVQTELLQQENDTLKKALNFKNSNENYTLLPAAITGHSANEWDSVVQINLGSLDGIHPDMPVIDFSGGLVGRVTDVANHNSKVILITDNEKTGISAQIIPAKNQTSNQPVFGIVSGSGEQGTVKMGLISRDSQIAVGQDVVTSGFSDMFPKGLVIGQITKIVPEETGLTQSVLIKPAADLDHLEDVFVVIQAKP